MASKSPEALARKVARSLAWYYATKAEKGPARRARDRAAYAIDREHIQAERKAKRDTAAAEGIIAMYSARHKASRERANEAFLARNPGYGTAAKGKRRARQLKATPLWLTKLDYADIARWYRLAAEQGLHVDHIVPLAGKTVCGLHVPWNMQLLTKEDNSRKNNRLLLQEAA